MCAIFVPPQIIAPQSEVSILNFQAVKNLITSTFIRAQYLLPHPHIHLSASVRAEHVFATTPPSHKHIRMARTKITKRKAAVTPTQDPPDAHPPENLQIVATSTAPLSIADYIPAPEVKVSLSCNPKLLKAFREYQEADNKWRYEVRKAAENDPKYMKKIAKITKKEKDAKKATVKAPSTNLYHFFMAEQQQDYQKHSRHYVDPDLTEIEQKRRVKGLDKGHKFYNYEYKVGKFQKDSSDEYILNLESINERYMTSEKFVKLPEAVQEEYRASIGGNSCPLQKARSDKIRKMLKGITQAADEAKKDPDNEEKQKIVSDLKKKKDEMERKLFPVDDDGAFKVVHKEELENTVTTTSPTRASKRAKRAPDVLPDGLPDQAEQRSAAREIGEIDDPNDDDDDDDDNDVPNPML